MRHALSHNSTHFGKNLTKYACYQSTGGEMHSTLEIKSHKKMTAEEILEEIEYPLENLENFLLAMTKMKVVERLEEKEFSAIINTLHYQVSNIKRAVHTK